MYKFIASKMPTAAFIGDVKVLGELIKAKRTEMGIELADYAALCGAGINTLSRLENGDSSCRYFDDSSLRVFRSKKKIGSGGRI